MRWNEGVSTKRKIISCHYCGQEKVILDLNIFKSHVSDTYTKAESHHTKSLATKGIFCGREL